MEYNEDNFYIDSKANFKGCKRPNREADYVSYCRHWSRSDKVSSVYYYGCDSKGEFVIRGSDHWSHYKDFNRKPKEEGCYSIASCYWSIKTNKRHIRDKLGFIYGKAYFKDFKRHL